MAVQSAVFASDYLDVEEIGYVAFVIYVPFLAESLSELSVE